LGSTCNRGDAEIAEELLGSCLRGEPWSRERVRAFAARAADDPAASRALFGILVEGLSDRFEPRLVEAYAEFFAEVIATVLPEWTAGELLERYRRVRAPRRFAGDPGKIENVFVLSRVTLGADIAVTSLVLDAAKRRFPGAEIRLVGGIKSYGLFAGDPRIRHILLAYERAGTLRDRLAVHAELASALGRPASVVIDPDSRLSQLGVLPVCSEETYYFFESRSYGAESDESLTELTRRWLSETFDVADAEAYLTPREQVPAGDRPCMAVSLGVGENLAKRIPDPFEEELLRALVGAGLALWVDTGPGGEEAERVKRALAGCEPRSGQVHIWRGSFPAFASLIAQSRLYVGYDSAGQHAAAACGVPLVCIFAGFPCPRMFTRWRPTGPGPSEVIRVENPDPAIVLPRALEAVHRLFAGSPDQRRI